MLRALKPGWACGRPPGLPPFRSFSGVRIRPEFDREDFSQFAGYCLDLGFNFIGFSVLTPLPGTDLYDE